LQLLFKNSYLPAFLIVYNFGDLISTKYKAKANLLYICEDNFCKDELDLNSLPNNNN